MPSPSASQPLDTDASDVRSVVARYRRAERAVGWTLALLVVVAFLAAVVAISFWPGVAVGAVIVVALRVPVFRRRGSTRLRTDASPGAVVRRFGSARPPNLAFQWGVADEVRSAADTAASTDAATDRSAPGTDATYEFSYLLGLKSVELDLSVDVSGRDAVDDAAVGESDSDHPPVATVEIEGTADGRPWASYAATVRETTDGGTVVDLELRPTRRFGLRRLPQGRVAERYYAEALAAQGYEVVERSVSMTR
ncbi:hypothetical protein PN419_12490 [Halorubrum ezzemoulense]|jgi:hypothetical protein|uniref:Uncharacterized protein n=2 Tax=Halorubrum ezzemoulense TaxID=337243 RepID=A0A256K8Z5_HALEZ|nr:MULTISPECIES: hypothetical protein [Halorubrum]MDB2223313.1 hypothetical protein [Halorubrum ezzemoulense]MDB2240681.1 hypothetical protein [Halorubrum ezzemoulense]MDB2261069.1 hypothetical protein [Halorubrum ezzemoulense]MDB2264244.1 hypothetical protein [Halorubrum ezzemoulense]MDB2267537.1 hypothetical protein [Halorubrum ezzemoulense]